MYYQSTGRGEYLDKYNIQNLLSINMFYIFTLYPIEASSVCAPISFIVIFTLFKIQDFLLNQSKNLITSRPIANYIYHRKVVEFE